MLTPEDRAAIGELLADYGHVVDDHDWGRAHEVFAEDFVFDRSATGRPDLHGIADIVANFQGRNMYAHVTTNTTLTEVDEDTVRGHSKFLGFGERGAAGHRRLPRRDRPDPRRLAATASPGGDQGAQVLRLSGARGANIGTERSSRSEHQH